MEPATAPRLSVKPRDPGPTPLAAPPPAAIAPVVTQEEATELGPAAPAVEVAPRLRKDDGPQARERPPQAHARPPSVPPVPASASNREAPARPHHEGENGDAERGATAPQLRRFIKSRAYVPMHELRRRFAINGADDEVTAVDIERRRVFVGLPEREGQLLGELLRGGDIGYELSLDPITPIVVGVYPMRPVTRI
jgi:hypothetical protein